MSVGLVSPAEAEALLEREARLERVKEVFRTTRLTPGRETQEALAPLGIALEEQGSLAGLVRRPEVAVEELRAWVATLLASSKAEEFLALGGDELARVRDDLRYEGLLHRERETIERLARSEGRRIPDDIVYRGLPGLSLEAAEKLERHRPRTLGQASRIPGVSPAAVTFLLGQLAARERKGEER